MAVSKDNIERAIEEHNRLSIGAELNAETGEAQDTKGNSITLLPGFFVLHVLAYARSFGKQDSSEPPQTKPE